MAVASDVGTGTIAVSCEDRQSRVYFPYVDDRVPCENNVVRTLSNNRTVDDSRADSNSPLTAAVMAAGTNVAAEKEGENAAQPQGAVNRSNSKESSEEKEKESAAPPVVPSPEPNLGSSPSNPTNPGPGGPLTLVATCVVGSNPQSCTASGSGLAGAQVGGTVLVSSQVKDGSGTTTTETYNCGTITSSLTFSCSFTVGSGNRVFQNAAIAFAFPLAAGGGDSILRFWNCFQPAGTRCP
jgi:hypothetical protein